MVTASNLDILRENRPKLPPVELVIERPEPEPEPELGPEPKPEKVEAEVAVVAPEPKPKPKPKPKPEPEPRPKLVQKTTPSRGTTGNRVLTVEATAYTSTGNKTATGTWPVEGRTIAVDPDLIKSGTIVRVGRGQGLDDGDGLYTAEDTGGRIKGKIIDIYMNSESACEAWGRRTIKIELLN